MAKGVVFWHWGDREVVSNFLWLLWKLKLCDYYASENQLKEVYINSGYNAIMSHYQQQRR